MRWTRPRAASIEMARSRNWVSARRRFEGNLFARIDREIDIIRFAWNDTMVDPLVLAQRYLRSGYTVMEIRNGTIGPETNLTSERPRDKKNYDDFWKMIRSFAADLPDMRFVMNTEDEPRIARNPCFHEAYEKQDRSLLAHCTDMAALRGEQAPTAAYLAESCPHVVAEYGDTHGFFLSAVSVDMVRPRLPIPVFSFSKISDCFDDIIVPTIFHDLMLRKKSDVVPFHRKEDRLYWRGADSGVHSFDPAVVSRSHRFRLVEFALAKALPRLDVAFSHMSRNTHLIDFYESEALAGAVDQHVCHSTFAHSKYNLVIDGNTASMSEFGLFHGNSIILWDSIFESYYSDWFEPHFDYHPVRPNMSDFLKVFDFVRLHEDAAARRAKKRHDRSAYLLTADMMKKYWFRTLKAYANAFPGALLPR
eukprot:Polyplicarium_translucidae@DN3222_c3_g1_i10.p1